MGVNSNRLTFRRRSGRCCCCHRRYRSRRLWWRCNSGSNRLSPLLLVLYGGLLLLLIPSTSTTADDVSPARNNPYQYGCLYAKNLTTDKRVCNSEDPSDAAELGLCRPAPFPEYAEIRIVPGDWESCFFGTWIVQIALSELLGVPTSVEMGDPVSKLNLYHPHSPFDYPSNHGEYVTAFQNSYKFDGDCSKANQKIIGSGEEATEGQEGEREEGYQQCGHFSPEEWNGREATIQEMVYNGDLDPLQDLGMLASESWYVPKYTANAYPSLLSYNNLQESPQNPGIRQLLAELFKRPTTWGDYCHLVSPNNCSTPDPVARRPPTTPDETNKMFQQDSYTGYFRYTDKNNCTLAPTECTGHFTDWPCAWRSPVPSQLHYLKIALSTDVPDVHGGYTYSQLIEIWRAANATRSHVVMFWWKPELFVREFQGTDYEFVQVSLPEASQKCMDARLHNSNQCSENLEDRISGPEGACGDPPKGLHTLISSTIYTQAFGGFLDSNKKPAAIHSPSYAMLGNYRFSELQLGDVFTKWQETGNPRQAICDWVGNNMDYMHGLIPRGYPRVPELQRGFVDPLMYAATVIGSIVGLLVVMTMILVGENKNRLSIRYAQVEFLALLLVGALLVALGAIVIGIPSSNTTCILEIWFINIGYTLLLVPLIVKVAAVNHVMNVGRMMKRIRIRRDLLFGLVLSISILVAIFLILWTVLDPPRVFPEYELTNQQTPDGETIVKVVEVCSSKSRAWSYMSVGWNGLMLLATCIQAIQMRKIEMTGFNETPTLALMVYSSLMFVLLRGITYMLSSDISEYTLARCRSLIYSFDTAANIIIYFMPKLFAKDLTSVSGNINISASSFHDVSGYHSHSRRGTYHHNNTDGGYGTGSSGDLFGDDSGFMALAELRADQQRNKNKIMGGGGGGGGQTTHQNNQAGGGTGNGVGTKFQFDQPVHFDQPVRSSARSSARNTLATTESVTWDGDGTPPGGGDDDDVNHNHDIEQVPPLESYNDNSLNTDGDLAAAAASASASAAMDVSERSRNDTSSREMRHGGDGRSSSPSKSPQGGKAKRRISFKGLRSASMPLSKHTSTRPRRLNSRGDARSSTRSRQSQEGSSSRSRQGGMKNQHKHSSTRTPRQRDSRSSWIVVMRDSDIVDVHKDRHSDSSSSSSSDNENTGMSRLSLDQQIEQLEAQRSTLMGEKETSERRLVKRIEMLEEEKVSLIIKNERRIEGLEEEKKTLLEANELQQKEIWELRAQLLAHASSTSATVESTGTGEEEDKNDNDEDEEKVASVETDNRRAEAVNEEETIKLLEANELQQQEIWQLRAQHLAHASSPTTGHSTGKTRDEANDYDDDEQEEKNAVVRSNSQIQAFEEEKRSLLEVNELQQTEIRELEEQVLALTTTAAEETKAAYEDEEEKKEKNPKEAVAEGEKTTLLEPQTQLLTDTSATTGESVGALEDDEAANISLVEA